jgi:hypothetical protein
MQRAAATHSRSTADADERFPRTVALVQAAFYAFTGIWSLVGIRSFQKVTGPKADIWLVKTVGVLVTVIGGALGLAGYRKQITPEITALAIGSAAGLATIDVVYVAQKRIRPVYLLDAAAEIGLIGLWGLARPPPATRVCWLVDCLSLSPAPLAR